MRDRRRRKPRSGLRAPAPFLDPVELRRIRRSLAMLAVTNRTTPSASSLREDVLDRCDLHFLGGYPELPGADHLVLGQQVRGLLGVVGNRREGVGDELVL